MSRPTRGKLIVCATVAAALALTGYVWAVRQPDPVNAVAPAPNRVTTAVTKGSLQRDVRLTCQVQAAWQQRVSGDGAVVTDAPRKAGDKVTAGSQLIELNGRPVIVLRGDFPLYRTLTEGDTGKDVAMLQKALRDSGKTISDKDAVFGAGTARAIDKLYRQAGSTPPTQRIVEAPSRPEPAPTGTATPTTATQPAPPVPTERIVTQALPRELVIIRDDAATITKLPNRGDKADGDYLELASAATDTVCTGNAADVKEDMDVIVGGKDPTHRVSKVVEPQQPAAGPGPAPRPTGAAAEAVSGRSGEAGRSIYISLRDGKTNPDHPITSVQVVLERSTQEGLIVPASAIGGDPSRLVVEKIAGETVEQIPVRVIMTANGRVQITADRLAAGDKVLVVGSRTTR